MTTQNFVVAVVLTGMAALSFGLWMAWPPLGPISAGIELILLGLAAHSEVSKDK